MENYTDLASVFPIGVKYAQHRDMEEKYWDVDFENMKACGLDAIRIHAFWASIEPEEGSFVFDQYDRIVEKAAAYDMKIMFTLYLVAAPEWIFEKHPDSRFVSAAGTVWDSNQGTDNAQGGWPGLCFDSEPFRLTCENFVRVFTEHYSDNPAILAFDIWHEPTDEAGQGPISYWKEGYFCYCDHSIRKFRNWLEKKYGSLEKLNQVWTRHYSRWDQVQPPRNYGIYTDWLDWRLFRIDALTDSVQWLNSLVKKYDPKRPTSVHVGIYEMDHPSVSSDYHFKLSGITDRFACSLYETKYADITGFTLDLMRSACHNGPFWIGETETGSGPMFDLIGVDLDACCFSRPATAKEIFKLSWQMIAGGAKGIFYWGWRPDRSTLESISLGLTERDGELTERTDGLRDFTKVVHEYSSELLEIRAPKSRVCILYNIESMIHEGIISFMQSGSKMVFSKRPYYKDVLSFFGCYHLCMKNGIQPDILSVEELDNGRLSDYELAILPYDVSVRKNSAEKIKEYVQNGGKIISDGLLGFFTDEGWASEVCPPHGLDEVFGLRTRSNYVPADQSDIVLQGDHGQPQQVIRSAGRFLHERCRVYGSAKTIGTFADDLPAIVINSYGKGVTAYIATLFFSDVVISDNLAGANTVFRELLDYVGFSCDIQIEETDDNDIIEVRTLISPHSDPSNGEAAVGYTLSNKLQLHRSVQYIFVINHTEKKVKPVISVPLHAHGEIIEILSGERRGITDKNIFKIVEGFAPLETKVYRIG